MNTEIRIYVACLAAYNNGILHGEWIDATQDMYDIQEQVNAILNASPIEGAEEYAIHDYEGFDDYSLSEHEGLQRVVELAQLFEDYPALAGDMLRHFGDDIGDARHALEECYSGCYGSLADYAEEVTDNTSEVPEQLAFYIDYERMGRDIALSGDVYTIETAHDEVHVFWSH